MAKSFRLRVQTPGSIVLEGLAVYCSLPTTDGSVGILADHAPMVCAVREGTALFRMESGEEKKLHLSEGAANVRDNSVTVLTGQAEEQ
ncbi:MAG: F0F1 ATP synthase subunit epsilon [Oscillospiraceae bacterium]|nr:F0F1 ATP synthase subunit epsilon [Oscillospiraceae bacterium]